MRWFSGLASTNNKGQAWNKLKNHFYLNNEVTNLILAGLNCLVLACQDDKP
jgi:hypothetical protein